MENEGVGEPLGQLSAPGLVFLHHLALDAQLLQLLEQVVGDPSAANDEGGADPVAVAAQYLEELAYPAGGAGHIDLIPHLRDEGAVGNHHLCTALHGAEEDGQILDLGGQVGQGLIGHMVPGLDVERDDLRLALGKGVHVGGVGQANHPGDVHGGGGLGVDELGDAQVPAQVVQIGQVVPVAHPGHGVGHAQALGGVTAQQVDFVRAGGGDDNVRILSPCVLQHGAGGTTALDAHHVQLVGDAGQGIFGDVHHGDVVVLRGQVVGDGGAHLSGSGYDNIQNESSRFSLLDGLGMVYTRPRRWAAASSRSRAAASTSREQARFRRINPDPP